MSVEPLPVPPPLVAEILKWLEGRDRDRVEGEREHRCADTFAHAVSIRVEVIAASRALRDRAAQTLVLFGTVLFVALFLAIPDQTYEALGGELLALAVVTSAMLVYLNRRAHGDLDRRAQGAQGRPDSTPRLAVLLHTAASNSITVVLLVVAALLLVFGLHAGLYVLVAPVIVAFAGGVVSAWLLLTRLPTEPESDGSRGP